MYQIKTLNNLNYYNEQHNELVLKLNKNKNKLVSDKNLFQLRIVITKVKLSYHVTNTEQDNSYWTAQSTVTELWRCRGKAFDPKVITEKPYFATKSWIKVGSFLEFIASEMCLWTKYGHGSVF